MVQDRERDIDEPDPVQAQVAEGAQASAERHCGENSDQKRERENHLGEGECERGLA